MCYNDDIMNAIATSAAVGMTIAIAGSNGFMVAGSSQNLPTGGIGFVNFEALITIVVASIFFAPLGAKVTLKLDSNKLKKGFSIFLAFLAAMVLLF